MTVGRAGVARVPERGGIDIDPNRLNWQVQRGVWVQPENAPDAQGGMATLVTERYLDRHVLGDFYRLPCSPAIVALVFEVKPRVGRPWFVVTANGNMALRTVFRLRSGFVPEITDQPTIKYSRSTVVPLDYGYFRCRVQVPDRDGLGFFAIATLNLAGDAVYDGNFNLGYYLGPLRMRYLCL